MSSSIDGRVRLYTALNVAGITALIDDYEDSANGKALFYGLVIPSDCLVYKTINYYMIGNVDCTSPIPVIRYSINCRAQTESESFTIAQAVVTAINMVSFDDYYITCSLLATLPPADDTDVFNTPIEIVFKQR